MKRLFKIPGAREIGKVIYFTDKPAAKRTRRNLNGTTQVEVDGKTKTVEDLSRGYRVARGPDHWRGES